MNYYVFPGIKGVQVVKSKTVTAEQIIDCVNRFFSIECRARNRKAETVGPRLIAYKLIRDNTSLSFTKIGDEFGVDHTTVMYGVRRMQDMIDTGDILGEEYEDCCEFLKMNL